jgi:hypothetical protein
MEGFRFNIGEYVLFRRGIEESLGAALAGEYRQPLGGVIVERLLQECPGGLQRHYKFGCGQDVWHNEITLAALAEFDAKAVTTEARKRLRELNAIEYAE